MESGIKADQELEEIERQIAQLEAVGGTSDEARKQLREIHNRVDELRKQAPAAQAPAKLDAWKRTELARHPNRPYTLDYVQHLFTDFSEIHGDRAFSDDPAMICGMARFHGEEVLVQSTLTPGVQRWHNTRQSGCRPKLYLSSLDTQAPALHFRYLCSRSSTHAGRGCRKSRGNALSTDGVANVEDQEFGTRLITEQ